MSAAHLAGVAGTAALAGIVATWAVRRFALARGIVNHPNPLVPQHVRPVAYLGGLAIFSAVAATVAVVMVMHRADWFAMVAVVQPRNAVPAALFLILGIVDDLRALRAATKFVAQILIAALAVWLGVVFEFSGAAAVDTVASVFIIVTIVNAFNLTDVCDGLVGGLSIVLFSAVLATGRSDDAVLVASIVGACAGFLVFNAPPASIFLGDAGSHLLGFLAAAALLTQPASGQGAAVDVAQVLLLAGVPLFELAFLIAVRTRKRIAWWRGSPDHFALRMQARGLTRLQTDLVACAAAAALAAAALMLPLLAGRHRAIVVTIILMGGVLAWRVLLRWELPPKAAMPATVPDTADDQPALVIAAGSSEP